MTESEAIRLVTRWNESSLLCRSPGKTVDSVLNELFIEEGDQCNEEGARCYAMHSWLVSRAPETWNYGVCHVNCDGGKFSTCLDPRLVPDSVRGR